MESLNAALILILAGLALVLAVSWLLARTRVGRGNQRRQVAAAAGERGAERLLAKRGYAIVGRQVTSRWTMWVDDEPHPVHSRADLVVERRGKRFVAEVKTGARAPDPTIPATRRQLMEYARIFDVDGVLLIDMAHKRIRRIRF